MVLMPLKSYSNAPDVRNYSDIDNQRNHMVQVKNRLFFGVMFVMSLLFISDVALAKVTKCEPDEKTKININPRTSDVEYDYTRDLKDIQKTKTDTVDPYGIHSNSITQGFMEGQISMKRAVDLDYKLVNKGKDVCMWYKSIDIDVHIIPKIVIAKEIKRNKCMYKAVLEHEKKHVHVDRMVVNEASKTIGLGLYELLTTKGFAFGPVPREKAQIYANAMVKLIMDTTQKRYEDMTKVRSERQGAVDSLEEYQRVSALCPNFYKHKKLLYKKALKQKKERPVSN